MEQCSYIQPEAMEGASLQPIREIIEAGMRGEKKKIAALGASVSKGETVKKGNAFLNKMEQKWEYSAGIYQCQCIGNIFSKCVICYG